MTPLQRTQEWMSQEQPSREDIQQTVDNLCNQLPIPPRETTREELLVAISWLMSALGGTLEDLVLPETSVSKQAELDYGLLVEQTDLPEIEEQSPEEKMRRFKALKDSMQHLF